MAGQKATIDKDSSDYRSPSSAPESERETAYNSQNKTEGPTVNDLSVDRNGNKSDVFSGSTKPYQGRRKADQKAQGTPGSMDDSMDTATLESASPFKKILSARFGLNEDENPGVSSSSATSDNPSLGMQSINSTDFKQSKADVKAMLEGIALQAAEAFEVLDENNQLPDSLTSELDQCTKVLNRLYEFVTNNQRNNPTTGTAPVENDPATMPVRREETEMSEELYRIRAESITGEAFESEKMTQKEAEEVMEEMIDSGAYSMVEMKLSKKQKKIAALAGDTNKIDASDLATLRAKRKMQEAVAGVAGYILKNGL